MPSKLPFRQEVALVSPPPNRLTLVNRSFLALHEVATLTDSQLRVIWRNQLMNPLLRNSDCVRTHRAGGYGSGIFPSYDRWLMDVMEGSDFIPAYQVPAIVRGPAKKGNCDVSTDRQRHQRTRHAS